MSAIVRISELLNGAVGRPGLTDTVEKVPFPSGSENFQAVQAR